MSRHRVYDVQYSEFVCAWCLLEVGVDLLNQNGFGLFTVSSWPYTEGDLRSYLNVGLTEVGDGSDLRSGDTWWFEIEHGLKDRVQLRYSGRHCKTAATLPDMGS